MSALLTIKAIRDLTSLVSEAGPRFVEKDRWGMFLRRIRHEKDIASREPYPELLERADQVLASIAGDSWPSLAATNRATEREPAIRAFLSRTQDFPELPSQSLRTWWGALSDKSETCTESYRCDDWRERTLQCNRFPCPAIMQGVERAEITPEALIYRLNGPSPDEELTTLGHFLRPFCTTDLFQRIKAVYFTFYYPGNIFHHSRMGWVAIRRASRVALAESWNFIHWARGTETNEFLSPSRIIQRLVDAPHAANLVEDYWVMCRDVPAQMVSATRTGKDVVNHLPESVSRSSLDRGVCYFVIDTSSTHRLAVAIHRFIQDAPSGDRLWLHDLVVDRPDEELTAKGRTSVARDKWPDIVRARFAHFMDRILANRWWTCSSYVRFPVLPKQQLLRGADVFVALDSVDPRCVMSAIDQLTDPLSLCAALIVGRTAYKAAEELEVHMGHRISGFLSHELKHRIAEITESVGDAVNGDDVEEMRLALQRCQRLVSVLRQQFLAARNLGRPEPDSVKFSELREVVDDFLTYATPHVALPGFAPSPFSYSGFEASEEVDRRIILLFILLLHNAAKHSKLGPDNAAPGVRASLTRDGALVHISVESWYSPKSDEVLKDLLTRALPSRPENGFGALLAVSHDLNWESGNHRGCFSVASKKEVQLSSSVIKRWHIEIEYSGRFRI